jgi:hypothetical protein
MLYLDQPVQTGFSYDEIIVGTIDETALPYNVTPAEEYKDLNSHTLAGQFASQNPRKTTPSTLTSAALAWHFMQVWIQEYVCFRTI